MRGCVDRPCSTRRPGRGARPLRIRRGLVRTDESGFSIIEVLIATGVFAVVSLMVAGMLTTGLRGVLLGKRREVATEEANKTLEIARSLSYDQIGLVSTDPTIGTDTSIVTNPSGGTLKGTMISTSPQLWEPLVFATNPSGHPFNPHTVQVTRGSTQLTRSVYVTAADTDGDSVADAKRVYVKVAFVNTGTAGPENVVRAQTLINQSGVIQQQGGAGGLSPLTGETLATGGSLRIDSALLGLTAPLEVSLATSSGDSVFRAVSSTNCTTRSTAIQALNLVDLPAKSVTVTADDDAASATPSNPAAQTDTGVLSIPIGVVRDLVGAVVNSPVSCEAAAEPLATEEGEGAAIGVLNPKTTVLGLGGLINWLYELASVSTMPVGQSVTHEIVSDQREVVATSTTGVGQVQIQKIPLIPSGLVQIDALTTTAQVRGAAGTPSQAPSVTTPSFVVRVFDNGSLLGAGCLTGLSGEAGLSASRSGSYCVYTVNTAAAGFNGFSIGPISHNFTQLLGLNLVEIAYTTSVDVLPPAKSPQAGTAGPNGEKRWSAEYTPLKVSASLDVGALGISLIDADVNLNLGSVKSEACAGVTCL